MSKSQEGYGVVRTIEDAKQIAATAEREGLKGCYPAAAVVLNAALNDIEYKTQTAPEQFDYISEAMRTNSPSWHGDKVAFWILTKTLADVIKAIAKLDAIKKTLFYGRDLPQHLQIDKAVIDVSCKKLPTWFKNEKFGECIIHATIGIATEAGELLEALLQTIANGKEFDEINAKEELGDVFWYMALLADTCGFTFDEAQRTNIAKLRARYPEKFTAECANNRNLEEERKILEK